MTLDHLQQLREWRSPREVPPVYSRAINRIQKNARGTHRHLGDFIEQWERLLPESLACQTTVEFSRGGTVHIKAKSAAISYEIDRLLREGLLTNLRRNCSMTVANIKVRVGELNPI